MALCTNLLYRKRFLGDVRPGVVRFFAHEIRRDITAQCLRKDKFDPEAEQCAANPSLAEDLMGSWPFSSFYGIKRAIENGAYLQARTSAWKSMGETDGFGMRR